jgi:hypothetical protein
MGRFFKSVIWFTIPLILYFIFNLGVNLLLISSEKPKIKKARVLILGDSHIERGLDPSFFSSAINVSQEGEPYPLSYWKLKKLLEDYNPDTVVIGFTHHNISAFNDFKFSDEKWSSEMLKRAYLIGTLDELNKIGYDKDELFKVVLNELLLMPRRKHIDYIGGYSNSKVCKPILPQVPVDRHYFKDGRQLGESEICEDYLEKMLQLIEDRRITPILVGSPVHHSYLKIIPEEFKKAYEKRKLEIASRGIRVVDYSNLVLPDSLFFDADHLNEAGANYFSPFFVEELKRKK